MLLKRERLLSIYLEEFSYYSNLTEPEKICKLIEFELKIHPVCNLTDIYKIYYQGYHGPGHFVSPFEITYAHIQKELSDADRFDELLIQPVGYKYPFYRANLSLINEKIITLNDFTNAFIESNNFAILHKSHDWIEVWKYILSLIEPYSEKITDYSNVKNKLFLLFKDEVFQIHHSFDYNHNYHPHYRVIHGDILKKLLPDYMLPLLVI